MDLLGKFKEYLFNQKNPASKITIKNYLADVNQFIRWFEEYFKTKFESSAVTPQIIELYKSAKTTTTVIANEVKQSHDLSADKAGIATSRLQRTRDDGNDNPRLSPRSLERHMSSLRKFFHFLKIEGIITSNPFELKPATHNLQPDPYYLKNFKDHLYVYNASALTIKNYIIDVKQFLNWAQEVTGVKETYKVSEKNIFLYIDAALVEEYKQRLLHEAKMSPNSINRKLSALRRYMRWAAEEGLLSGKISTDVKQINADHGFATKKSAFADYGGSTHVESDLASHLKRNIAQKGTFVKIEKSKSVEVAGFAPAGPWMRSQVPHSSTPTLSSTLSDIETASQYSKFPPIRLAQKVSKGINIAFDRLFIDPLAEIIEKAQYQAWKLRGKKIFKPLSVIARTLSSSKGTKQSTWGLPRFARLWRGFARNDKGAFVSNLKKEFYAPLKISTKYFPMHKKVWHHLRHSRPEWYRKYHSYPVVHYFHFAILIIFMSAIGVFIYQTFIQNSSNTLAAGGTSPVSPLKILSFQGRLTDASDNPITTAKQLRFTIYDDLTASESGTHRIWEEVRTISPDTDGIFSTLLGSDGAGGNAALCNNGDPPTSPASGACGIPQSLFANNSALYLGVTVESDSELTPRQQLATVSYATNSELLQGLPPTTDSTWSAGSANTNAVLALNSSGTVAIVGTATTTFQSSNGQLTITGKTLALTTTSSTDIVLNPNGTGKIDLQKPLTNTSNSNNITSATGAVEVDDLFAVLATSSGQSAFTVDQTGGGPIISASASGIAKFTVNGSATLPTASISANTNFAALVIDNKGNGDLFTASSSGLNRFVITQSGMVGIAKSIPTTALDVTGAGTFSSNVAVNGGTLSTTNTSASLFNANATTLNIGAAATTLALGASTGTATIANATTAITGVLNVNGTGNSYFTGNLGIGTTSPLSALDVRGANATTPTASISANSNFAALVVDNKGNGDLFTASSSGLTRFVITQVGRVGINVANPSELLVLASTANTGNAAIRMFAGNNSSTTSAVFNYTGGAQMFTVPPGVTAITVDTRGAKGGGGYRGLGTPGKGGRIQATLSVTPGQILYIYVGGKGSTGTSGAGGAGGYNGGGNGGLTTQTSGPTVSSGAGGGGGASDIRVNGTGLANRVIVAGGGGAPNDAGSLTGGNGGGTTGGNGQDSTNMPSVDGGKGGTQAAGGAAGTNQTGTSCSFSGLSAGSSGTGGTGGSSSNGSGWNPGAGGGGGGGYYGGGGGGAACEYAEGAGGAGGSNYAGTGTSVITHTQGYQDDNGQVIISYAGSDWVMGADQSDNGKFKIAHSGAFGVGVDLLTIDHNGNLAIGTPSANIPAQFMVFGRNGTTSTASVSAKSSFAGLVVDNTVGDLFTASSSGLNRFVITQAGSVGIGTTLPSTALHVVGDLTLTGGDITGANGAAIDIGEATSGDIEITGDLLPAADNTYDLGSTAKSWQDLYLTGNLCFDDTDCMSTAATGFWDLANGALYPKNATLDLFVGGTATTSAKFAVLNVNNGTPVASVSAQSGTYLPALVLSGDGSIQAVRMNTLTLGGTSTGNIILDAGSGNVTLGSSDAMGISGTLTQTGTGQVTFGGNVDATNGLDVTTANLTVGGANFTVAPGTGNITTAGDLAVNGGDITTTATTWNFDVGNTGTINFRDGTNTLLTIVDTGTTGNIGINTSTTLAALDVRGSTNTTPTASVSANSNFAAMVVDNKGNGDLFTASSSGLNRFVITQNGMVGIGTTTPSSNLHVFDNSASPVVEIEGPINNANAGKLRFLETTSTDYGFEILHKADSNDALVFRSLNAGSVNVDNILVIRRWDDALGGGVGRIGIGTGSPDRTLHIAADKDITNTITAMLGTSDGTQFSISGSADSTEKLVFGFDTTDNYGLIQAGTSTGNLPYTLALNPAGGNVGIGTTSPLATLDVRGNTATTPAASVSANSNFAAMVVDNSIGDLFTASSSGMTRFVITQNGNVGIGTSNPQAKLDIGGSSSLISNTAGDITINSASNNISFASDSLSNINNLSMTGNLGVGTASPIGMVNIVGAVSGKALVNLNYIGSDQNIFTASASGLTKFYINNAGNTYASQFVDIDNTSYFLDPAATGTSIALAGKIAVGTTSAQAVVDIRGNATSDDVTKTTSTDFTQSGSAAIGVDTTNDQVSMNLGTAGMTVTSGPALTAAAWNTAHTIQRPDGKFLTVLGNGTATNIYDPATNSFSTGPNLMAAAGTGAHAIQRPDGHFIVILGNNSTTTNIYNIATNTFKPGPVLTAAAWNGAHSFPLPNGTFLVVLGNSSATTNIYNPATNTFTAGPSYTVTISSGGHTIPLPNGKFITLRGGGFNATNIYDPATNSFTNGPNPTAAASVGGHSFQLPNGKFMVILGNASTTTNIYDPTTNSFTLGPTLSTTATNGAHSFQRPDGKWISFIGGADALRTSIYDPATNSFSAGTNLTAAAGTGAHVFQRPDGKYIEILGNNSTTTNIIDAGWRTTGSWESEDIDLSNKLSSSSAIFWKSNDQNSTNPSRLDAKNISFQVKTADSVLNLGSSPYATVSASGDFLPQTATRSANFVKTKILFNIPIPSNPVSMGQTSESNIWRGESNTFYSRHFAKPTVYEFGITNPISSRGGLGTLARPWATGSAQMVNVDTNNNNQLKLTFDKNINDNTASRGAQVSVAPALTATAQYGSHSIQNPNGTFLVIHGANSATSSTYNPALNTFSTGPNLGANASNGSHSFQLPNGKFITVIGNTTVTTKIYDPLTNTFSTGPALTTTSGLGANSFQLPNGKYITILGNGTNTNIYDPISNAFTAGPALTTSNGSYAIQRPDGKFLVDTNSTTTNIYDPVTNSFYSGPAKTASSGGGKHAFQRSDGKFVIILGINTTTTNIYDPATNSFSAGPALTAAAQSGSHSLQRPDGKFLTVLGNSTDLTNIYDPATNSFSAGPALTAAAGDTTHSFQGPDGKFVTIIAGGTTTTNILDLGWALTGTYVSDIIYSSQLGANTVLSWNQGNNLGKITAMFKSASTPEGLGAASWTPVPFNGATVGTAGNTYAQVRFDLSTTLPTYPGAQKNTWVGSDGGLVAYYRPFTTPILNSYSLTNRPSGGAMMAISSSGSQKFLFTSEGAAYTSQDGGWYAGGADVAEYYSSNQALEEAEVVAIDPTNQNGDTRVVISSKEYQKDIVGVVSTKPGFVAGAYTKNAFPIALVGRVPVKVTTQNGIIKAGDPLTSSSIPGVATKATKPGVIIGKALENYDASQGVQGTVVVFVNPTYYDPSPAILTSIEGLPNVILNKVLDLGSTAYQVRDAAGNMVDRAEILGGAVIGSLRAGLIEAKEINTDNITIAGVNLKDYIVSAVNEAINNGVIQQLASQVFDPEAQTRGGQTLQGQKLISPIAEVDIVRTNVISPLASDSVVVNGKLVIGPRVIATPSKAEGEAISGIATSSATPRDDVLLEVQGSASIAGTLVASEVQSSKFKVQSLEGDNATISGTLHADKIIANSIEGLDAHIARLRGTTQNITQNYATDSALFGVQVPQSSAFDAIDITSYSAQLAITDFSATFGKFEQGLMVFGPASFADASVVNQLSIGANLFLADGSINVLGSNLELQPLRQGGISMLGGLVSIDTEGNLKVGGNAQFAKDVTVGGKLTTNFIAPIPNQDLVIRLSSSVIATPSKAEGEAISGIATSSATPRDDDGSKLVINNALNSAVLTIDNKGNIIASGAAAFSDILAKGFNVVRSAQADTSFTETIATASAGTATIITGETERTIVTPFVTEKSLIYFTPTTDTQGVVPYLARQTVEDKALGIKGSFTIQIPNRMNKDITVNWWIVN